MTKDYVISELENVPSLVPRLTAKKLLPAYTHNELRERILKGEYLVIVDGYVLNLTGFASKHPGGAAAILNMVGKDATDEMHAMHPDEVFTKHANHYIVAKYANDVEGFSFVEDLDLEYSKPTPVDKSMKEWDGLDNKAIAEDYRKLENHLRAKNMYKCNYYNYAIEATRILAIFAGMIYFTCFGDTSSVWRVVMSSICAALLWQQEAFTAHDLGHAAVTGVNKIDTSIGLFVGDFLIGLSTGWWKDSHNVHHIVTNQPENDPDIQHLPFMAISPVFFFNDLYSTYYKRSLKFDAFSNLLVQIQHKSYYIIMTFGRYNLYVLSWVHVLFKVKGPQKYFELLGLTGFWVWYSFLLSFLPSYKLILLQIWLSHSIAAILHVQLTLSHFGMPVHSPNPETECFMVRQIRTSLDIVCPSWMDWFHGGLHFQVEHHLFPRLPRHNLPYVKTLVKKLCEKHGIKYSELSFFNANVFTLGVMENTANTLTAYLLKKS
ncbi:Delta(8)-fatty-acid desaturase [Zancudomyces culisetae]|uniref:Delta(8)-fatty-acid desaturase n=1 Tax=Zancudomyces culisetae TaxID=1213189 RepID=A0A1R1PIN8_ZANCU|nr:Delta(8)-fatty-acid desaturase [Zancudomyces culisetae]|eukprot:OMH80840.1 Delta(8)-fatty-acid desaturase [Zancudomyces culisetae]